MLYGVSLGCIGLSSDDFCSCTPFEFKQVYQSWQKQEESKMKDNWERSRMMMLCALQPYSQKTLLVRDVMVFPWEENNTPTKEDIPKDELLYRYKEALKNVGLK